MPHIARLHCRVLFYGAEFSFNSLQLLKKKLEMAANELPDVPPLVKKMSTILDKKKCCFKGANEEFEIEDYEEFTAKVANKDIETLSELGDFVFQEVDFSAEPLARWNRYDFSRAWFWGCTLPPTVTVGSLRARGAMVTENPKDLPFKPFRAFLYTQQELRECDAEIYAWYKTNRESIRGAMAMSAHDFSMSDALADFLEGRTAVSFMGGHAMERDSDDFAGVVWLAWRMARAGYIVASGGGPGAMAASCLGGYLFEHDKADVEEALALVANPAGNELYAKNYMNMAPERAVLERFGEPTYQPSLSVPTFFYAHEPTNMFARYVAKYFANAVREDALIQLAHGGIVFFPGSAGTVQEVFQFACILHYSPAVNVCPMVFVGVTFWSELPVFQLLKQLAGSKPYARWLLLSDDVDEIVDFFLSHASEHELPLITDVETLKQAHWRK
jgi:predicted Rossmann-fold nucleotide-binding protein